MRNERLKRAKIMLIFKSLVNVVLQFFFSLRKQGNFTICTNTHIRIILRSKKVFTFGIPCERLAHNQTGESERQRKKKREKKGVIDDYTIYIRGMSAFCGFC